VDREAFHEKTFEGGSQLGFLAQEAREVVSKCPNLVQLADVKPRD